MRWFVGTSGYSYKEWKGHFYPADLPASRMLEYYATRLNAVEINNTFYRMPKRDLLVRWSGQVPDGFRFVLKASRRITHDKRMKDAADPLGYLLDTASVLGDRLGPILFQFPPYLKKDLARLRDFLALFPSGQRAAFEFRSSSWLDDEVYDALRSHGVALVTADADRGESDPRVVSTADYGYLRLRRESYGRRDLERWADLASEQEWSSVHVFFKHEDDGAGPRLAAEFNEVLAR